MNIAIIPARGGSKRIKNKNIKLFLNKPIILFTIEKLIKSNLFNKIFISTDSDEIASISRKFNVEIINRPKELSDDFTNTNEVVKHALEFLQSDYDIHTVCCVYPTAPFMRIEDLKKGLENITTQNDNDKIFFSFPVTEFLYPIERALKIDKNLIIKTFWNNTFPNRSQDLSASYHDVGQFYWGKFQPFLEGANMFSGNSIAIKIPKYLSHDIDNKEDWARAELYYEFLKTKKLI